MAKEKQEKHNRHHNCECLTCKLGKEAVAKMEAESIEKYGWYAHYVFGDKMCPSGVNIHTHYLVESFGHKDIQLCINIDPTLLHFVIVNVVDGIRKGIKYEPGKMYAGLVDGFKLEFIDAIENGRKVLRLLIPDEKGKYTGPYAEQLTKLNNADVHPIHLN
jgi:hypothetical protein